MADMLDRSLDNGTPARTQTEDLAAALLVAAGMTVSILFGAASPHGIVQFDDLTHYLYAKWAWRWPAYLLDEWGRPGFTALYFLPAKFGWPMCRVLSAVLTAWSTWLAYRIAQRLGLRHAWAVVPLAYAQPLYFQLSQTTLTETPTAFYLTMAVYLSLRGRWSWSAAFLSLGFVTRHEAVVLLPVWALFAFRARVPLWRLWPLLWAPILVNGLAPLAGMRPPLARLLDPGATGQYGRGGWLTFFSRSMEAFGPGVAVLAMTGLWSAARRGGGALAAACVAVWFAVQTVLHAAGLFDSGGYARFLVPISPLVAVAALDGWHGLWASDPRRRGRAVVLAAASMGLLWAAMERQIALAAERNILIAELPEIHQARSAVRVTAVASAVIAAVCLASIRLGVATRFARPLMPAGVVTIMLLAVYALCHPLRPPEEAFIIEDTRRWLNEKGYADRPVVSAVVWMDYAAGRELPPWRPSVREQLEQAPIGAIFAWDRQFAASPDHNISLRELHATPAFRWLHESAPLRRNPREPYLTLFEKVLPWKRPAVRPRPE